MQLGKELHPEGLESLVHAIFSSGEVTAFESYSAPDEDLLEFHSPEEVFAYIHKVKAQNDDLVYLSLYFAAAKGYIQKRRIELDPRRCKGSKYRYKIEGWGLIQFQLWLKETGTYCDIGVNSEKRASNWSSTYPELKEPSLWEWKEVERQNRRLNRVRSKYA